MSIMPIPKTSEPMAQSTPSEDQTVIEQPEGSDQVMPSSSPKVSQWQTSLPDEVTVFVSHFLTASESILAMRVCPFWAMEFGQDDAWKWRTDRLGISTAVKDNIPKSLQKFLWGYQSKQVTTNGAPAGFDERSIGLIAEYYVSAKDVLLAQRPTIAFGREEWIQCFGVDPGEVPRLPPNFHEFLKGPCPFFQGTVEQPEIPTVERTHKLVYIPSKVTKTIVGSSKHHLFSIDITVRSLGDLAQSAPGSGNTGYLFMEQMLLKEGDKDIGRKGRWVLMTEDVIPGSGTLSYAQKQQLLRDAGYKMPRCVDVAAVCFSEKLRTGQRLLSEVTTHTADQFTTVTRVTGPAYYQVVNGVKEVINYDYQVVIDSQVFFGNFTPDGPGSGTTRGFGTSSRRHPVGVVGMREF